jgi:hypothetical protein
LKAVCKYCRLQLHTKSCTSSLRGSCPIIEDDVRKQFVSTMKKQPLERSFVFDPQVSRERLVDFCIHPEIPFNKFEDPYCQPFIDSLRPEFKVKGRQTIRDDCFKKYNQMKKDLQDELNSLSSPVCITSDMWTSSHNLGYMAVTAHYIDADSSLKKKIISFKEVKYPHTGYAIEEAIVSSLTDWGIRGKLFKVTVDNASNNTTSCEEELVKNNKSELLCEGEHLHVRCCGHILNILVQDGMKIIQAAISKIRELLKHIDSFPSRLQTFNSLANAHRLPPKHGIYIDIPNIWNATFKMLREALSYKSALNSYANQNLELSPSQP